MININNLLPAVKELIYNSHLDGMDDVSKLKSLIKFNWLAMDVMADALEIKANNEVNNYFVQNIFRWYSIYAKSYNFLFDVTQIVIVSKEDKQIILKMVEELTDIDDADAIIDKLNSLLGDKIAESNSGEFTEEKKEHVVEEISNANNSEQVGEDEANEEKQELPVVDVNTEKETDKTKQDKTVKQATVKAKVPTNMQDKKGKQVNKVKQIKGTE